MSLQFKSQATANISGEISVPGDKSISHRAIMLAAIAVGESEIHGVLTGADCLATMRALQQLGVQISAHDNFLKVQGVDKYGLQAADVTLDCGNSGTTIRLLSGLLVGQCFTTVLSGDASLQKRPMQRVITPLRLMGAKITAKKDNYPPLEITGVEALTAINYQLPVASAQVKSAILLAGLYANGRTIIKETQATRNHTELMFKSFNVAIEASKNKIILAGKQNLTAAQIHIPGDISSAAFFIVAALITPNSHIKIKNVGVNPTRLGIIHLLRSMGARISVFNQHFLNAEPVADIEVMTSQLYGIKIPNKYIAAAIDEFPILFIAAANAQGRTVLSGAQELRVKETDRLHAMAQGLQCLGIQVEEFADGLIIEGGEMQGGEIDSFHDHRVAMAFAIAGLNAQAPIIIRHCDNVKTSFPNFIDVAQQLNIKIEEQSI